MNDADLKRIGQLYETLTALKNKRNLAEDHMWIGACAEIEAGLVNAFADTGAGQDAERAEIAAGIRQLRRLRTILEGRGESPQALEDELDQLEGRKVRPIA